LYICDVKIDHHKHISSPLADQHSILIIEDDFATSAVLSKRLRDAGFVVVVADNGKDGLNLARRQPRFDIIILDVMLPGMNGIDLLHNMRLEGIRSRVLVLTVKTGFDDRVRALEEGADDFVGKPFDHREIILRIENLLRSAPGSLASIEIGDMVINRKYRTVQRGGMTEELTDREYSLLLFLVEHANQVMTKGSILAHVWGGKPEKDTNVVNAYLSSLRKKLERKDLRQPIETVHGAGVRLSSKNT